MRCTSSRSTPAPRCRRTGRSSPSSPSNAYTVDPAEIAEHRDEWLTDWSDLTSQ